MGVIINTPDPFVEFVEDALENLIEESFNRHEPPVRKQRKQKPRLPVKPSDSRSEKSGVGNRRKRRHDNVAGLMAIAEIEIQDLDEVTIYDFIPSTVSAFARMLMEKDTMIEFNKFINCSEEEQEQFFGNRDGNDEDGCEDFLASMNDQRNVHPAFSADVCFQKMETRFRNALKRKHLPLGNLVHLEEEVISFFKKWPRSIYKSKLESSFDRLMLHGLCQYLQLRSQSITEDGLRQTHVKNPKHEFVLPNMNLSDYLQKRMQVVTCH